MVRYRYSNITDKWEFERIVDVHDEDKDEHGLTYLIKWKYNDEETWEPEDCLKGCERALTRFHEQHPEKPGPPAWLGTAAAPTPRRRGRPRKVHFVITPAPALRRRGRPRKAR